MFPIPQLVILGTLFCLNASLGPAWRSFFHPLIDKFCHTTILSPPRQRNRYYRRVERNDPLQSSFGLLAFLWAYLPAFTLSLLVCATQSYAESSLALPFPPELGEISANTYTENGQRVGPARMKIKAAPNGRVSIEAESGIEGGARTLAKADLVGVPGGKLRPVYQSSQTFDQNGKPLGRLEIDHKKGIARCHSYQPKQSGFKSSVLTLPDNDRVANVPMNLVFQPLVRGQQKQIDFQLFVCRGGGRLIDVKASIADRSEKQSGKPGWVEVRYKFNIPKFLAWMATPLLPKLSFWFDENKQADWLGHRMPLYVDGPTVLVMREGQSPYELAAVTP